MCSEVTVQNFNNNPSKVQKQLNVTIHTCMFEQSQLAEVSQEIFVEYHTLQRIPGSRALRQPFLPPLFILCETVVATCVLLPILLPAMDAAHMMKYRGPPASQLLFEDKLIKVNVYHKVYTISCVLIYIAVFRSSAAKPQPSIKKSQ